MSNYQAISKVIKDSLANVSVPVALDLKSFPKTVLEESVGEEAALFGFQNTDLEINKRTLTYSFTEPIFIDSVRIYMTSSISTKSFGLSFFGTDQTLELQTFKNGMLSDSACEIKVGFFLKGFEITANKHIKKSIKGIEVLGYDKSFFNQNLTLAKTATSVLTTAKEKISAQLVQMDSVYKFLSEKEIKLADIDTEIKDITEKNDKLKKEIETLVQSAAQKKAEIDTQRDSLSQLKKQQDDSAKSIRDSNEELDELKDSIKEEQRTLNALLEKKSFYNETLVGHKKETSKNIAINFVLMAGITYVLYELIHFVMQFYKDTITQISLIENPQQLIVITLFRTGAGVLFFFIFKYCFRVLSQMFSRTYQLVTDIRNIEGKLVVARAVAETALKAGDFSSEERRNFSAAVAFAVMKNHFLNMSHESIVDDLEVNEDEVHQVIPRLPQAKKIISAVTTTKSQPKLLTKGPEAPQ